MSWKTVLESNFMGRDWSFQKTFYALSFSTVKALTITFFFFSIFLLSYFNILLQALFFNFMYVENPIYRQNLTPKHFIFFPSLNPESYYFPPFPSYI